MERESLTILLEQAASPAWDARAKAATGLAAWLDTERAAQAMLALLCDDDDTAVGEAAVRALWARDEPVAADLVFEAVSTASDDVADHLLLFIAGEQARHPTDLRLLTLARDRSTGEGPVADGARQVVDYVGA